MELTQKIESYIEEHQQEAYDLLLELAQIPAPSNEEELRAKFCWNWLENQGAEGVYVDDALNVIYPVGVKEENPLVCFVAHSDVVFPDREKLPLTVAEGKIFCKCERKHEVDEEKYGFEVFSDGVLVKCRDCGAECKIATDNSLNTHAFLDADALYLE